MLTHSVPLAAVNNNDKLAHVQVGVQPYHDYD
jgi:hypothetical protein